MGIAEHAALAAAIGGTPSEWACYRFISKVREHSAALVDCLDRVTAVADNPRPVAPIPLDPRAPERLKEEMSSLVISAVTTAATLVVAAAAMRGVTLSVRGLLIAVAVIVGVAELLWIMVLTFSHRMRGRDEVAALPFWLMFGPLLLLMGPWAVAGVLIADAVTDGFNVNGSGALTATILLIVCVGIVAQGPVVRAPNLAAMFRRAQRR